MARVNPAVEKARERSLRELCELVCGALARQADDAQRAFGPS